MTRAKEKEERRAKAIARATTIQAAEALRFNVEPTFRELFPKCDVSLKFEWERFQDGKAVESDLFSAACYGTVIRKNDDLARLIVERMIAEGVDLKAHRTSPDHGFTTLMLAAIYCDRDVLSIVLPHSDPKATTFDGITAAQLAREIGSNDNADYIDAFTLSQDEVSMFDDIPIPPPRDRANIDDR